jgi:hypothetical protein
MLPTAIDAHAIPASAHVQRCCSSGNAVSNNRKVTTSAAIFVAADMKAVTGVGAPWYASGVHMWKGAADVLKARPATIIARPRTSSSSLVFVASAICAKPSSPLAP